jgi:hypothetical protein
MKTRFISTLQVRNPASKPRNPWAVAASRRAAGRHASPRDGHRRDLSRALRTELSSLSPPRDP